MIARRIAEESGRDEDIILYGLTIFTNSFFGYVLLIVTAYFFGWLSIAITAAVTASLVRVFTGGLHAKTNLRCIFNGAIIFNMIAFLSTLLVNILLITNLQIIIISIAIIAVAMIVKLAPVDVPEKRITNKKQRLILKLFGSLVILIWSFIMLRYVFYKAFILASVLGLVWQLLTLFKFPQLPIQK